jgi:hypothetical protein
MTQQINNQDKQPADCQEHADPEHNESDCAVNSVINTHLLESPCCSLLLSITSTMPEDAVKRNGIRFNIIGDFLDKGTFSSSYQDGNMVYTYEAGLRIILVNNEIISCANRVGTKHVSLTRTNGTEGRELPCLSV